MKRILLSLSILSFITALQAQNAKNVAPTQQKVSQAQLEAPSISIHINKDATCKGRHDGSATVRLLNDDGGEYTYKWNTDPVQYTATASGLKAGMHLVTVTNSRGQSSVEAVTIINQINIQQINNLLSVYPNPNRGQFRINIASELSKDLILKVYDITGREVFYREYTELNEEVQISDLAPGIYTVNVTWKGLPNKFTQSVLVQ